MLDTLKWNRTMKLHASGEDYLEAILVLHKKMGTVRSVDVARHMEVGAAMLGIVFCADFCEVQIGPGCFGESGVTLNLTGNSDIAAKRHI